MISNGEEGQANFILSRVEGAMVVETLSVSVMKHAVVDG
jgi:hypothetical protein